MYRHFIATLALILCAVPALAQPRGWATMNGGTDGSRGENPVVVTTCEELVKALGKRDSTRRTIYVKGRIQIPGLLHIKEVSNKTVIGLPGSALVNDRYTLEKDSSGILMIDRSHNIVLQNLIFLGPGAFDRDANDNLSVSRSTHIWVDHCDFQDGMDGNFDASHGADFITVSWCRFRYLKQPWPKLADDTNPDHNSDHRFSNLWGSSDRDTANSQGRLNTTFDHCWWDEGCRARMPFVRFGQIHLLNCLYSSSVATVYIQSRFRSNVLAEGCVFVSRSKNMKLFQTPFSDKPELQDYNIRFRACLGADDLEQCHGDAPYFEPSYPYTVEPAGQVEAAVMASAGATMAVSEP